MSDDSSSDKRSHGRNREVGQTLAEAYKLALRNKPARAYATNVAYDSKTRLWNAWYVDQQLKQVGFTGRGIDPVSAVRNLLEVGNPTPEGRFTI